MSEPSPYLNDPNATGGLGAVPGSAPAAGHGGRPGAHQGTVPAVAPAADYAGYAPGAPVNRPAGTNVAGRLALGLVIAVVILDVSRMVLFGPAYLNASTQMMFGVARWLGQIGAFLALIFGIIGLLRPGLPRGAAAAGTAVAGYYVLNLVVNLFLRSMF